MRLHCVKLGHSRGTVSLHSEDTFYRSEISDRKICITSKTGSGSHGDFSSSTPRDPSGFEIDCRYQEVRRIDNEVVLTGNLASSLIGFFSEDPENIHVYYARNSSNPHGVESVLVFDRDEPKDEAYTFDRIIPLTDKWQ
jgi:hypothetical protein